MAIKLGINGFGRIGRVIFRACLRKQDLKIAAINDPAIDIEYICYLIKFDSTHGKFCGSVTHTKEEIFVEDSRIKVFHQKLPSSVPWQKAGVQYVVEASGMFTSLEKASGHLASDGVKRVIVTAPSVDVPMIIIGVNHDKLNAEQKVISCASSTLYCLAPIVKVLDDSFGVTEGFITSIHAMTPSLKPLDGLCLRGKHWRDHRSIHQNIIPATTGACKALGRIIPQVKDKLSGLAFRVPIVNVSVLDLTIRLNSNTSLQEIIKSVEKASSGAMQNIIKISRDKAVSSDFIGETHSCILDADSSLQLKPNFYKLVCWYENEYSYACRVLDSIYFSEEQVNVSPPTATLATYSKQDVVQQTSCRKETMCSASLDTGFKTKQQHSRLFLLRKPISSNIGNTQTVHANKDIKNRNDTLKAWNDDKQVAKSLPRQNKNTFFHSCVAIRPHDQEEIECIKAHERLEMLKKEFTKMVNITENLLKKSYITSTEIKPVDKTRNVKEICKTVKILPDINVEELKPSCQTFPEIQRNSPVLDMSGDFTSSIRARNITVSSKKKSQTFLERATSRSQSSRRKNDYEFQNKLIIFENISKHRKCAVSGDANKSTAPISKQSSASANAVQPEKFIKINDDIKDNGKNFDINLSDNIQVQCCLVEDSNNNKVKESNLKQHLKIKFTNVAEPMLEKDHIKWKNRIGTSDSGFFSVNKNNSSAETYKNQQAEKNICIRHNENTSNDNNTLIENNNAPVGDKDVEAVNTDENLLTMETPTFSVESQSPFNGVDHDDPCESASIVNRNSSPEQTFTESDHTSKCSGSPDNTSMVVSNSDVNKRLLDIYDKLDSISGTDSNNSFQIHERKSQVINFSDLTTSLENLARLDKICKIIEISDELSNKLFSVLDNTDGIAINNKKWSLKDLCERIKLDEFCEKVFGKSSI